MSLTRDEYNTLILGSDVCRIFLLTQGHLVSWASHTILRPIGYDPDDYAFEFRGENYDNYEYKLGECVNAYSQQGGDKENALSIARQFIYGTVQPEPTTCTAEEEPAPQGGEVVQVKLSIEQSAEAIKAKSIELQNNATMDISNALYLYHATHWGEPDKKNKDKCILLTNEEADKRKAIFGFTHKQQISKMISKAEKYILEQMPQVQLLPTPPNRRKGKPE